MIEMTATKESDSTIVPDERQRLDGLRALAKAGRAMLYAAMAASWGSIFLFRDTPEIGIACGVIALIGINVYGYYMEKSGWLEYRREQIHSRPSVKRGEIRFEILWCSATAVLWFCVNYFADSYDLVWSIAGSILMGIAMFAVRWWFLIRPKPQPPVDAD
jgi:hypothetical protein